MNKKLLKKMIDEGYVKVTKHPDEDLFIYNYTPRTQYEYVWNEVTINCRGIIMDKDENILTNPFQKIFNMEELVNKKIEIPKEEFEVYDKMDGSLGILYWIKDKPFIATRGSFTSEQAKRGTKILYEKYSHLFDKLDKDKTYLFEIIYPENRIVVDYGNIEDLILLAIRSTRTGNYFDIEQTSFNTVKRYNGIKDYHKLRDLNEDNNEGFIVRFDSGFMMKLKYEEYKRLHKILTNVSNKSIWELLSKGENLNELIEKVPDEFYDWVRSVERELKNKYNEILEECDRVFLESDKFITRKEFAIHVKSQKYPHILFQMNDKKDYKNSIWRLIKPEYSKPFKVDLDS